MLLCRWPLLIASLIIVLLPTADVPITVFLTVLQSLTALVTPVTHPLAIHALPSTTVTQITEVVFKRACLMDHLSHTVHVILAIQF